MTTQQPEALRALAESVAWTGRWYDAGCNTVHCTYDNADVIAHDEIAHPVPLGVSGYIAAAHPQAVIALLDRIAELEAQLSAIGAGGVSPLIGQQTRDSFTAADMATAEARGFRDGVASVAASAGSEPVAGMNEYGVRGYLAATLKCWHRLTGDEAAELVAMTQRLAGLYTHPSPPEGMVGGLQVYRCKIKSRKQIDKEIPREQQGWWADIAAGQKLLLRQAVQSDLDRCTLGGKRSRDPADYMCETQTNGSLVSKVALEYMNPEQNVFAAAPGPSDGESNG